jgi:hypothetical protein
MTDFLCTMPKDGAAVVAVAVTPLGEIQPVNPTPEEEAEVIKKEIRGT